MKLKRHVTGSKMATAFGNEQLVAARRHPSRHANEIRAWIADQWPKAAIILGFGATIAWVAALVWLLNALFHVF